MRIDTFIWAKWCYFSLMWWRDCFCLLKFFAPYASFRLMLMWLPGLRMFLTFLNFTISNLIYSRTKITLRTLRIIMGALHKWSIRGASFNAISTLFCQFTSRRKVLLFPLVVLDSGITPVKVAAWCKACAEKHV